MVDVKSLWYSHFAPLRLCVSSFHHSGADIAAGTVQIGVLRQIAGSAFVAGAGPTGLATALNSDTLRGGFAAGVANVAQTSAIGGFAGTALARVPAAPLALARATGLTTLTRTIITNTGTAVVNIFDRTLVQAVRIATAGGTAVRDAIESVFTSQRINVIAHFLFTRSEQESLVAIRDGLRNLLSDLPGPRLSLAAESAMSIVESSRGEFGTLGQQGIRDRLLGRMQAMYLSFTEVVDNVFGRLTGGVGNSVTRELAEQIAERLAGLQNIDNAAIKQVLQELLPGGAKHGH